MCGVHVRERARAKKEDEPRDTLLLQFGAHQQVGGARGTHLRPLSTFLAFVSPPARPTRFSGLTTTTTTSIATNGSVRTERSQRVTTGRLIQDAR
jgi:hypothetical protein